MAGIRKIGTYFVDGLSAKSNKHLFSKNYKTIKEAINVARDWQNKGKIVQAEIIFTKNILTDVPIWDLDTTGKVKRYNEEKGMFEEY